MLVRILKYMSQILQGDLVGYSGATTYPSDARDIFSRWRAGEALLDGPHIREFESALSGYHGGRSVITFGAGRMALYAILKGMDIQEGDEVILPGYTCVVTSNAVRFAGLRPVYVDVSKDDFNLIPELIGKSITAKTRAIVAQHTFGIPCDIEALQDISKRTGIPIIEDGAHAIGARWGGDKLGNFGYAAFFSTQATKMISTDRGGYVVTADRSLAGKIRRIQEKSSFRDEEIERASLLRWCYYAAFYRKPGLFKPLGLVNLLVRKFRVPFARTILEYDSVDYKNALAGVQSSPYPCRLPNLMAYVGQLQLRCLEEDLAHRRHLADYLEQKLPQFGAKVAEYDHKLAAPSWNRFPFVVKDCAPWRRSMLGAGLLPGYWLNDPIHPKGADWRKAGYSQGKCPNAEYLSKHILNIPVDTRVGINRIDAWIRGLSKHGDHKLYAESGI